MKEWMRRLVYGVDQGVENRMLIQEEEFARLVVGGFRVVTNTRRVAEIKVEHRRGMDEDPYGFALEN